MVSIVNPVQLAYGPVSTLAPSPSPSPASASSGRIKAPPVCLDSSLKETAMTAAELSQYTFPAAAAVSAVPTRSCISVVSDHVLPPVSSCASSTCTRESIDTGFSDGDNNMIGCARHDSTTAAAAASTDRMNAVVSLRQTSRQGRATQRWVTDPTSGETIRLTTGAVPILRGGKILFVSASRKPEWIFPKGGWEQDETLEESAVRECFEEAGVLGVLGPQLNVIQYETRKAKKRRLGLTMMDNQEQHKRCKSEDSSSDEKGQEPMEQQQQQSIDPAAAAASVLSDEAMSRIREQASNIHHACPMSAEETSSIASVASACYNQVRMTLFPLYVSSVEEVWPESGRFRKAVDIDEAIQMLESRPELQKAILDVKERGLHLLSMPETTGR